MRGLQSFDEPLLSLPDVSGARIVRTIGKPQGNITALKAASDLDAVLRVRKGSLADRLVRIAKRTIFISLILENIGVDLAWLDAKLTGEPLDLVGALHSIRTVPLNVEGHGRTDARKPMDLPCITQFFFDRRCRRGLQELPETRAGVRETPRRDLNTKSLERLKHLSSSS